MKKAVSNFSSLTGLALTQVINLSIYLSPNITRIAFYCALKTGFNFLTWRVWHLPRLILHTLIQEIRCDKGLCGGLRE